MKSSAALIQQCLLDFINKLNEIPFFRPSAKIFIPENNYGNEASWMWNFIKNQFPYITCFTENGQKCGIRKGPETAEMYQLFLNVKLSIDFVKFDINFFTSNKQKSANQIKAQAREELERYHIECEEPMNGAKPKQKITGKGGPYEQDDLAIAILTGGTNGQRIIANPRLMNFA